jgi:hypothetical protein
VTRAAARTVRPDSEQTSGSSLHCACASAGNSGPRAGGAVREALERRRVRTGASRAGAAPPGPVRPADATPPAKARAVPGGEAGGRADGRPEPHWVCAAAGIMRPEQAASFSTAAVVVRARPQSGRARQFLAVIREI